LAYLIETISDLFLTVDSDLFCRIRSWKVLSGELVDTAGDRLVWSRRREEQRE
jgi:hypothetical protein